MPKSAKKDGGDPDFGKRGKINLLRLGLVKSDCRMGVNDYGVGLESRSGAQFLAAQFRAG